MDSAKEINDRIATLTHDIENVVDGFTPGGDTISELYFERAKLYYRSGRNSEALNDFLKVVQLDPANTEAREYEHQIREIFDYRYMDYYNP